MMSTITKSIKALKNWFEDPFFYDAYEALRSPDPTEINRIYDRNI